MRRIPLLAALSLPASLLHAQPAHQPALSRATCEGCGAYDAPAGLSWRGRIAPVAEPGTPLVISGTVYRPDGRTPAAGVLVYAYHTDATGVYPHGGTASGLARRHGRLRGWVRTDSAGRYQFVTIHPGAYPGRVDPAHVHLTVTPPSGEERWIDVIEFDDDPRLTVAIRHARERLGGSGIVHVRRDAAGVEHAERNIVLVKWP